MQKPNVCRDLQKLHGQDGFSLGKAIEGVHADKIPLVLTLKHFEEQDALMQTVKGMKHISIM